MNKFVTFEGIGYVAATFPVSSATKTYLETNHTNPKTGNVDINGKNLAVTLNSDGTVGFPASGIAPLFGVIKAYEMDGFASVQIAGGIDEVPTAAATDAGLQELSVSTAGALTATTGEGAVGRNTTVAIPSTSTNLFASIIL